MPPNDLGPRVAGLNEWYRLNSATAVLTHALSSPEAGQLALVSSFGAESVVLLHLVSIIDRSTPVIFIDTQMLFAETLAYQSDLAERLAFTDMRVIRAAESEIARNDPDGTLHQFSTDACCALRKTRPLDRALQGFDGWITGRKRHQSGARAALPLFETDDAGRLKLNPLADWGPGQAAAYIRAHNLPPHPLVAQGYPSIGCAPCTSPVAEGEDPRAGRWRGSAKTECGIHFVDGKLVRG